MIVIARRKVTLLLIFAILFATVLAKTREGTTAVFSNKISQRIIIDAGHGFPDGGAVGSCGSVECTLNLEIAKLIEKELKSKGYDVIMTRTGENCLSDEADSIAGRKRSDMYKRLDIINSSGADIFVSIHMNKFSNPVYRGAQVIYSRNFLQSRSLALHIQAELNNIAENKKKREALKAPSSLFLLKKAQIPSVIVECGFLSNFEEEALLGTKEYQVKLSRAVTSGIEKYYKEYENDENLRNR